MIRDIITSEPSMALGQAACLQPHRLPADHGGRKRLGNITETDMLRAQAELFGTTQPSSRHEVRMPNKAGEPTRIVRLIGIDHAISITGS